MVQIFTNRPAAKARNPHTETGLRTGRRMLQTSFESKEIIRNFASNLNAHKHEHNIGSVARATHRLAA